MGRGEKEKQGEKERMERMEGNKAAAEEEDKVKGKEK